MTILGLAELLKTMNPRQRNHDCKAVFEVNSPVQELEGNFVVIFLSDLISRSNYSITNGCSWDDIAHTDMHIGFLSD